MSAAQVGHHKTIVVLPPEFDAEHVSMNAYQKIARRTDRLPGDGLDGPLLGLFGEVGSLLSQLKKKQRDTTVYTQYDAGVVEELGDVLWYFATIASRAGLTLDVLAQRMSRNFSDWDEVDEDHNGTFGDVQGRLEAPQTSGEFATKLVSLAGKVGDLVNDFGAGRLATNRDVLSAHLVDVFRALVAAAESADVSLDRAAYDNLRKIFSRWPIESNYPDPIDTDMPKHERLPPRLTMFFEEHDAGNGRVYVIQQCNGITIGDRLTDNKTEHDDYRFHDVFHLAFAVHLHWSPVLRSLFRLKRKSKPEIDENQDGARASLIEEGVSTFIFGRGLDRRLFEGAKQVDYDLLKLISEFVRGYEVERCALWQWERAILDGFSVFRDLKKHRRGYVDANLAMHTLIFRPGGGRNAD